MTTREAVRSEERTAKRKVRDGKRLARLAASRRRESIARAIRETAREFPLCRCDLRPGMDNDALRELGAGCTHPRYVCSRLDAVRRRVGA